MKKHLVILCLLFTPLLVKGQDNAISAIKLELLKPLAWIGKGGYVIEPEFSIHHKNIAYNLTLGANSINDIFQNQYDYNNKGWYGQASILFRLGRNKNKISGFYLGVCGNLAKYEESGIVTFEGDQYEDYRIEMAQSNTTLGINWLASTKLSFNDHFFGDFTLRFGQILNETEHPQHPVYYVPGMGLVIRPEQREGLGSSIGFSIKIGYIL